MQRRSSGLGMREVLGDVADAEAVREAVAGQDGVVHLAAKVDITGPEADYVRANVVGTRNVLAACTALGVERLVQVSSPSVSHTGSSLVGAPGRAGRPGARARPVRADQGAVGGRGARGRPDRGGPAERRRRPPAHRLGAGRHPARRAHRRARPRRPAAAARHGRRAWSTRRTSTTPPTRSSPPWTARPRCTARRSSSATASPGPSARSSATSAPPPASRARRGTSPPGSPSPPAASSSGVWSLRHPDGKAQPPMTRFLAEQLSTAHWFDQRRTREALAWTPAVSIAEGLDRLAAHYRRGSSARD